MRPTNDKSFSIVRPSETNDGRRFIDAFDNPDRSLAAFLLDSLKLVDEQSFISGLAATIEGLLTLLEGPIALVPVGELPDGGESPISYESVDSRTIVTSAARRVYKTNDNVLQGWDLKTLRANRVRNLVFLDDFVASGQSLRRSIRRWKSDRTVRSWLSGGYIQIHAVAYAATTRGLTQCKKDEIEPVVVDASCDLVAAARRSTEYTLEEARRLIRSYGIQKSRGHGRAEGLMVIHHTVPNSLPSVFTQNRSQSGRVWPQLFNRDSYQIAPDLEALFPYSPSTPAFDLGLRHIPFMSANWARKQSRLQIELLVAARLAFHESMSAKGIAVAIDVNGERVSELLGLAHHLGLSDSKQLSRELRIASSHTAHERSNPLDPSSYYFPNFTRESG